ncbi:hypothetical protein C0992_003962 [Termitomyces sp. T32_za158]|nr:hypothetical protein C0992_003962 [Termitomyces sp. T32_za158]
MADLGGQPPGLSKPSASKYQPPPKWDDRVTRDISESFGMPGGLSVSWMKLILNPGSRPGDKSFASGSSLPVTNLASLIYPNLPENTTFSSGAMGGPVQYADTTQGSVLAHSTPLRTMQPKQGAKQVQEASSEQTTRPQGASLATVTRQTEQLQEEAPAAPPMKEKLRRGGKEPQVGLKSPGKVLDLASELDSSDEEEDGRSLSTLSVQLHLVLDRWKTVTKESTQKHLQLYVVKHLQLMADRGQHVPRADSTEYIELFARIFELELNEYIKCKTAQGTTTSTATPAESVDYDALLHQRAPDIVEAMDILNTPKQANESQQDYEKRQNAARRQANTSGMPRQALSEVETATSNLAGEDEVNTPPENRTPC